MKKTLLYSIALMALIFSCSGYAYSHQLLFNNQLVGAGSVSVIDLGVKQNGTSATLKMIPQSFNLRTNELKLAAFVPIIEPGKNSYPDLETLVKIKVKADDGTSQYTVEKFVLTQANNNSGGMQCMTLHGKDYNYLCHAEFINGLTTAVVEIAGNDVYIGGNI